MILAKFPSRSRPQRFKECLSQWVANSHDKTNVHYLFSFDLDDLSMKGIEPFIESLGIPYTIKWGTSVSKIHAVNRDINELELEWSHIIVLSDDMWPVVNEWDRRILSAYAEAIPEGDAMLWCFDGKQGDICTLPIMDRPYYDRTKYIYHPSYLSVWCDNEQTEVAELMGRLYYVETPLAHHRHPSNVHNVKPDALYRKNETDAIWKKDHQNYKNRKAMNFPNV
jgi:hypothetical protein